MIDPGGPQLPLVNAGKAASVAVAGPPAAANAWRRATLLAAGMFVMGAAAGFHFGPVFQSATAPEGAPGVKVAEPTSQQPSLVGALGRLMPEDDTTTLALPFASGDARVARLLVREGQRVTSGQVVAELDNLPQRMAQRATAAAELAAQRATLEQARSAARLSLAEARAGDDRARAVRRAADQELMRVSELVNAGMATRAQLDQAQSTATQAAADQARAAATIQRYAGRDADTQPDIQLAIRDIEVTKATLAQAEQDLASARVTTPLDGTVIAIHVRVGEKPGDRGIATLGNTDRMAAELEVYQTDIRKVALGQPVVLSATSLDAPLTGTVSQIGLEVNRQALLAADPAASTDARIIKVRVSLDKYSSERSRTLTGLQVIARISAGRT